MLEAGHTSTSARTAAAPASKRALPRGDDVISPAPKAAEPGRTVGPGKILRTRPDKVMPVTHAKRPTVQPGDHLVAAAAQRTHTAPLQGLVWPGKFC